MLSEGVLGTVFKLLALQHVDPYGGSGAYENCTIGSGLAHCVVAFPPAGRQAVRVARG